MASALPGEGQVNYLLIRARLAPGKATRRLRRAGLAESCRVVENGGGQASLADRDRKTR